MTKNYYSSYMELICAISKAQNGFLHAAIFSPYSKSIDVGGLGIARDGSILFDYLPTNGYSDHYIQPEDLNKNIYVLKNLPLQYQDAVFETEEVLLLSFDTLETFRCKIKWENHGYYCLFKVIYSDGATDYLSASEYMKAYCFLRK